MNKNPKASSGGSEHTANARPSTKSKHEAGQAAKKKSRGGESGDQNRDFPRRRPKNWRGGWPPMKFEFMENIIIQVGLSTPNSRATFRRELEFWAAQSKLIESWDVELGKEGPEHFWNLRLRTADVKESWRSAKYLFKYFESQYRNKCRRTNVDLSDPAACPPTIVVATRNDSWDDYVLLHHTDPGVIDEEEI